MRWGARVHVHSYVTLRLCSGVRVRGRVRVRVGVVEATAMRTVETR